MRARHGAAALSEACLRATMDATTTLAVQKLGRIMLRLDEPPAAAVALPNRVDGSPWSPRCQLPSHIVATRTSAGLRQAIPAGRKAAVLSVEDRFRRWVHQERTRLPRYQSSHLGPSLNMRHSCRRSSSVGHPSETRASSSSPVLVARCRASQGGKVILSPR